MTSCLSDSCSCLSGLWLSLCPQSADPGQGALTEAEFRRRIEFLGQVPLFQHLPHAQCPILAQTMRARFWEEQQVLLQKGNPLTEFTLVAGGSAEVHKDCGDDPMELLLPGDYFGENVLQSAGTAWRSPVRIVAGPGLLTLSISAQEFQKFGLHCHLTFPRRRALSRVLKPQHSGFSVPKSEEQRHLIMEGLYGNANFRSLVTLPDDSMRRMCEVAERREVSAGTPLFNRGDWDSVFYIVEDGSFELRCDNAVDAGRMCGKRSTLIGKRGSAAGAGRVCGNMSTIIGKSDSAVGAERMCGKMSTCIGKRKSMLSEGFGTSEAQHRLQRKEQILNKLMRPDVATVAVAAARRDVSKAKKCSVIRSNSSEDSFESGGGSARNGTALSPDGCSVATSTSEHPGLPTLLAGSGKPRSSERGNLTGGRKQHLKDDILKRSITGAGTLHEAAVQSWEAATEDGGHLGLRRRGESFGEIALLCPVPRSYTATAIEHSTVWCISQAHFREIVCSKKQQDHVEEVMDHLSKVTLLDSLLTSERRELAQKFSIAHFKAGDWLIRETEKQHMWFVIIEGECILSRRSSDGSEEELARLRPTQHFGDRALLSGQRSETSVRAGPHGDVHCLVLAGPHYKELAEQLSSDDFFCRVTEKDLLQALRYKADHFYGPQKQGILKRLEEVHPAFSLMPSHRGGSSPVSPLKAKPVNLHPMLGERSLQCLGVLGKGAFGLVTLELDASTQQRFALKTCSKKHIAHNHLQAAIKDEKQILTMVDSPFIIKLHATFQDATYLYFLFEPLLGGELNTRMRQEPAQFRSPATYRFILGCLACALGHLHERHVVYRDLKPENVLFAGTGYIKLCDLGFAKFVFGKTATLCGTPPYMAPETIMPGGHDRMVDWWALGILAYELLCGSTPFSDDSDDESPETIFANILCAEEYEVEFPLKTPVATRSLIHDLLQFKTDRRLGIGGAAQVQGHQFFAGVDFDALERQEVKPAYIPELRPEANLGISADADLKSGAASLELSVPTDDDEDDDDEDFPDVGF